MQGTPNSTTIVKSVALLSLVALLAVFAAGCSMGAQSNSQMKSEGAKTMPASTNSSMGSGGAMASDDKPDPNAQTCASCGGGQPATPTKGTVESVDGKQVMTVSIKDGTFTPNRFVAKAGIPTTVVFKVDGKPAKGCLSNPTFKSLNKTISISSGEKSLDLGSLAPGTYEFTCAMGMNMGQIVVE
jgi:hypothetical protein